MQTQQQYCHFKYTAISGYYCATLPSIGRTSMTAVRLLVCLSICLIKASSSITVCHTSDLTAIFRRVWVSGVPPRVLLLHLFQNGTSGISETGILRAGYHSCHPTIGVKALKGTQSTDPNQWPVLILSSFTTGFRMEGAWLLTCCLCAECLTPVPYEYVSNAAENSNSNVKFSVALEMALLGQRSKINVTRPHKAQA